MTLGQHQEEFTKHLVLLISKAWELGCEVRLGEVERTTVTQEMYVKTGRSKTMNSMHLKRCAADLIVIKDGKIWPEKEMAELGMFWETLHLLNRWGGNWSSFKDMPHFERKV